MLPERNQFLWVVEFTSFCRNSVPEPRWRMDGKHLKGALKWKGRGDRRTFWGSWQKLCGFTIKNKTNHKLFWLKLPTALPTTTFLCSPHVRILFQFAVVPSCREAWADAALCVTRSPGGCDTWAEIAFCSLAWPIVALLIVLYKANFYFSVVFLCHLFLHLGQSAGAAAGPALAGPPTSPPRRTQEAARRRGQDGGEGAWWGGGGAEGGSRGAEGVAGPGLSLASFRLRCWAHLGPRWPARRPVTGRGEAGVHRVPLTGTVSAGSTVAGRVSSAAFPRQRREPGPHSWASWAQRALGSPRGSLGLLLRGLGHCCPARIPTRRALGLRLFFVWPWRTKEWLSYLLR